MPSPPGPGVTGDAGALPLPDAAFDATVSAFGVIFAPAPARALAEMMRVTRPGGVIALTSWAAEGAIFEAGRALCEALPAGEGDGPPPRWEDAA
jgi:ubiquinone/menaquinone biosynthesis C-methylase UbiE